MDYSSYINRRNIIVTVIFLAVVVIGYIAFDNLAFRLKSISPSLERMPDSSTELRLHFSQPIKSIKSIQLDGVDIKPEITGRQVVVPFGKTLEPEVKHTLVLEDIESQWFKNTLPSIRRTFTPQYIAFNQLSDDEKKAQIEQSNSGQVDDAFISNNVFPIFNERWQIDATVDTNKRSAFLNVKFFDEVPNYDKGGEVTRVSNETAEKYRQEVLDEIVKRKGNPKDYQIFYENPYLAKKYPSTEEH